MSLTVDIVFLVLAFFAIAFPVWISIRASNRMDDTQKRILEITASIREQTRAIDYNIKEIIKEIANKAMEKAEVKDKQKEKVSAEIDSIMEELKLEGTYPSPSPSPGNFPKTLSLTELMVERGFGKNKKKMERTEN